MSHIIYTVESSLGAYSLSPSSRGVIKGWDVLEERWTVRLGSEDSELVKNFQQEHLEVLPGAEHDPIRSIRVRFVGFSWIFH